VRRTRAVIADETVQDSFDRWDVVVVPFPFTDRSAAKRRPALVLSGPSFNQNGHIVLAMITTATKAIWPTDSRIANLADAGLRESCVVRCNFFTLDSRLVLRRIGHLAAADIVTVEARLRDILP
jgi:mRNA interferase MazF